MTAMPNDGSFFTLGGLGTMAGASAATFVVTNAMRTAFGLAPRWAGLVVAEVICLGIAYASDKEGSDYVIALLNGCLVYLSAAGASDAGQGHRGPTATPMGREVGGGLRQPTASRPPSRSFLGSWF